ncbi:hypothetical protein LCGC14_3120050, partial [marine sediment metagenome]
MRCAVESLRRSRVLAICSVIAGLLTIVVGFGVFGMGMGFSNATASGTGAAAMCVGLWMVMAVRGVARRRPATFAGLTLAWVWLIGRVVVDLPATLITVVILGSLTAGISVPPGLAWLVFVVFGGSAALLRTIGDYRRRRRDPAAAESAQPRRPRRVVLAIGVRLGLLIAVTLLVPHWVWSMRGQEISRLAEQYAPADRDAVRSADFGACSLMFLGYELTRHGAESAKTQTERTAIFERTLADALADLQSIEAAGARYVRVGASGDHLLAANPAQEPADDRYM